jgi:hypothetical protein
MRTTTGIVGLLAVALLGVAACGGGGDSAPLTPPSTPAPTPPAPPPGGITYTPGSYPASSTFAAQCQVPRTGTDPDTGRAYTDRAGSIIAENHWLRSWTNELYLWYQEVPDQNPALTTTTSAYFDQLKTTALLPSGQAKDKFHFTYATAQWQSLSQSGVDVGYGISWAVVAGTPPRKVMVSFVESGSPAAAAGITRGTELLMTDGVDVVNSAGVDTINSAMSPRASGETHQFVFKDRGTGASRNTSLSAAAVTLNPVPTTAVLTTGTGSKVGYMLFNDHVQTAEPALISAVNTLQTANVQDLVLDLRYNGGGYLAIANELAYMIAGPGPTAGRTFERVQFNDKNPSTNPVTGQVLTPMPFLTQTVFATTTARLPTLNLPRVYVLTSRGTCSASESIINSLRGVGVAVYQIGPDTCGKPYGFYPQDNCGTTYFSIEFKGVNALGFGDYVEGFTATRTNGDPQAKLPGCAANDDLTRDLGDPDEERLRVAMTYRETGACTGTAPAMLPAPPDAGPALELQPRQPWRENRIL